MAALPSRPPRSPRDAHARQRRRYSSGEDLTSEEHLAVSSGRAGAASGKRTIKRTLSNSSVSSLHRTFSSGSLTGSVTGSLTGGGGSGIGGGAGAQAAALPMARSDLDTLPYLLDEDGAGPGCS